MHIIVNICKLILFVLGNDANNIADRSVIRFDKRLNFIADPWCFETNNHTKIQLDLTWNQIYKLCIQSIIHLNVNWWLGILIFSITVRINK